jgi:DNA-binding transcriptional ArsR family regulator
MSVKLGYYPMLDLILAMRQLYSVERFKPYPIALEGLESKFSPQDKAKLMEIGDHTVEWLEVIERAMDLVFRGVSTPEEVLLVAAVHPRKLFGQNGSEKWVEALGDWWNNYAFNELSRSYKKMTECLNTLKQQPTVTSQLDHLMKLTDRFERDGKGSIVFHIKPELKVLEADIHEIIVMPSIYASRSVVFWHQEKRFVFFVGLESQDKTMEDPGDMLLLGTLAFNDKTRLKMLKYLAASPLSVNDMADKLGVNASTASRHFKVFKDVGLVDIHTQEGNSIYYSLVPSAVEQSLNAIYHYITGGNRT